MGKRFLGKVVSRVCIYTLWQNRSISPYFQDKHIFALNTEIQDGCQSGDKMSFCEMSPVDTADTLGVKNFVKFALSHSVSEINVFVRFTQRFKMAAVLAGK